MSDEDEMIADVDRLVRAAVMAGSQLGERLIRSRAERDRQAAALTREDARQHQLQEVAHRDVARAVHRQVGDPQFWEKATPERLGLTFAAAYEWREHDGQAAASLAVLKEGLREHHGLDVDAVLREDVQDLDEAQRQVAAQVLGRYATPGQDLAQSLADRDRARADEALADAELDRAKDQLEQNLDEAVAVGDQGDPAEEQTFVEQAYQQYAADVAGHVDHDQAQLEDAQRPPGSVRPSYTVYRAGEAPGASPAAEQARLASAVHFPTSAAESLRSGHGAARARVVRATKGGRDRGQELGR